MFMNCKMFFFWLSKYHYFLGWILTHAFECVISLRVTKHYFWLNILYGFVVGTNNNTTSMLDNTLKKWFIEWQATHICKKNSNWFQKQSPHSYVSHIKILLYLNYLLNATKLNLVSMLLNEMSKSSTFWQKWRYFPLY